MNVDNLLIEIKKLTVPEQLDILVALLLSLDNAKEEQPTKKD